MVIDELIVRDGITNLPIDSYDGEMIEEIVYEGETFHFAKQKDVTGTSEVIAENGVAEPIRSLSVSGATSQSGTPSPEAPVPIENANDNGMSVSLHGENLYDISKVNGANSSTTTNPDASGNVRYGSVSDGILHLKWGIYAGGAVWTGSKFLIERAGKYYVSADIYVSKDIVCPARLVVSFKSFEKNVASGWASSPNFDERDVWVRKTLVVNIPETSELVGEYAYFCFQSGGNADQYSNIPMYAKNIMITYGEAKPYQPYLREEISIPTSVEVNGATVSLRFAKQGNYADKLIVNKLNRKVTYEQWVKTEPLPIESATWGIPTTANQVKTLRATTYFYNSFSNISIGEGFLMNKFKEVFDTTLDEQGFYMATGSLLGWVGIRVNRDLLETQNSAGVKKWLQTQQDNGDPVVFNYALVNPITHDITITDLGQSLLALATGKGTNILEITGDLPVSQTDLSYWEQIVPSV